MKYVIVSIYDCGHNFSICVNGKVINRFDKEKDKVVDEHYYQYWHSNSTFNDWLKEKYKDYDLIIICENGEIEIVKDNLIR